MVPTILRLTVLSLADVPTLAQSQDARQQSRVSCGGIDINGAGLLTRAKFRNLKVARWTQIDGDLSEDYFSPGAAALGRTPMANITFLDKNGDGRISRDEFLYGSTPMFTQSDAALKPGEIGVAES